MLCTGEYSVKHLRDGVEVGSIRLNNLITDIGVVNLFYGLSRTYATPVSWYIGAINSTRAYEGNANATVVSTSDTLANHPWYQFKFCSSALPAWVPTISVDEYKITLSNRLNPASMPVTNPIQLSFSMAEVAGLYVCDKLDAWNPLTVGTLFSAAVFPTDLFIKPSLNDVLEIVYTITITT